MRILVPLMLAALAATPAMAAATPWQDVAPGARLRLITSDVLKADGTTLVGLELDMPDTYKTYWRLPGETGIPTELDIKGSAGVTDAEIGWPYPTPEMSAGFLDYVYHGPTVLPVVLHISGDAPVLSASVLMGVCSEVCVPAKAQFNLPLTFDQADMAEGIRLAQAEALVPIAWTAPDAPFSALRYDAAAHGVSFAVNDPGIDPASIILSTSDPTVIFDAPQKSPDGRTMLLALRAKDAGTQWAKQPIRLTFMTPKGSFDISEQVTAP